MILLLLGGVAGLIIADAQAKASAAWITPCSGGVCSTSFWDYESRDSLCILDPTCVSPFYNYDPGTRHFMGIMWWGLSEDEDLPTAWQSLAWPNAILYLFIAAIMAFAVAATIRWRAVVVGFEAMLTVACLKTIGLWFATVERLPGGHSPAVELEQITVYGVAVALLTISVIAGYRHSNQYPSHGYRGPLDKHSSPSV